MMGSIPEGTRSKSTEQSSPHRLPHSLVLWELSDECPEATLLYLTRVKSLFHAPGSDSMSGTDCGKSLDWNH
eukprot:756670-Hanusia_phi.AAC.5